MKTKKLNLCEILKDCPKGTRLYSTVYGEVYFDGISPSEDDVYPILISRDNKPYSITPDGRCINYTGAECCLFPSKKNRDWSTFKAPIKRFDPKTLKPFDRVLVRDISTFEWNPEFFGYIINEGYDYPYHCIHDEYCYCIPYNDDTKHLLGTTDEAPAYYKYWE